MSSDDSGTERNYLAWSNLAYEAESHLMANGQVIPTETRIVLSNIRDLAVAMRDRARGELVYSDGSDEDDLAPQLPEAAVPQRGIVVPLEIPEPRRFRVAALSSMAAVAAVGFFMAMAPLEDWKGEGSDNRLFATAATEALSAADIRDLQVRLKLAGFDPGDIDGKLGPATRKAWQDWQARSGQPAEAVPSRAMIAKLRQQTEVAMRDVAERKGTATPTREAPTVAQTRPTVSSSCEAVVPADMIPITRLFFCELEKAGRAQLPDKSGEVIPKVVTPFGQRPPVVMGN